MLSPHEKSTSNQLNTETTMNEVIGKIVNMNK